MKTEFHTALIHLLAPTPRPLRPSSKHVDVRISEGVIPDGWDETPEEWAERKEKKRKREHDLDAAARYRSLYLRARSAGAAGRSGDPKSVD